MKYQSNKKYSPVITLLLVFAVLFGMAFKCGRGGTGGGGGTTTGGGGKTTRNSGGFEDGHVLKGRYSNSDQGIRSFTFYTDGRFERGGASSGSVRGGEYVSGSTNSGTYYLSGNTLSLTGEDGDSAGDLRIEVLNCCETPDYSLESPVRIKIDGVTYTNVD